MRFVSRFMFSIVWFLAIVPMVSIAALLALVASRIDAAMHRSDPRWNPWKPWARSVERPSNDEPPPRLADS